MFKILLDYFKTHMGPGFTYVEKFGPLKHDECYTFFPALALGGEESVKIL